MLVSNDPDKMLVAELPIENVIPVSSFNCRGQIQPVDVMDLVNDIQHNGLLQPVVVSPIPGGKYKLVAGYRRYMALSILQRKTIPCVITTLRATVDQLIFNLSENLQRKDLTITQEANALRAIMEQGLSEEKTAARIGRSRGWVQIRFMLLKLPEIVIKEVESGMVTTNRIRELYSIYCTCGEEELYTAVRLIKDAKIKGSATPILSIEKRKDSKRARTKGEVCAMMDFCGNTIGYGLHTRALAWAIGEITTAELFEDFKEYDDTFTIPAEGTLA